MLAAAFVCSPPAAAREIQKRRRVPEVEYSPIQPGVGGVSVYQPGKWSILNLDVRNPLDTPHELLSTTYFDGQPTLQFARRVWLPARSRLLTWQPVLVPSEATDPVSYTHLTLPTICSV